MKLAANDGWCNCGGEASVFIHCMKEAADLKASVRVWR